MLPSGGIIKTAMTNRGYKHRRAENQFSIRGAYTQNLQFVYSKENMTKTGLVVDLIYFAVDILNERLVIGLYRENADMENGVYVNASRALSLKDFNAEELDAALDQLIPQIKETF